MRLAVVFLSLSLAATSLAQTGRAPKKPSVPTQTVDFRGADVKGTIVKPVVDLTVVSERPIFRGLIQVRGSFANELHRSVDAIR